MSGELSDRKPAELAQALGIQLWTPVYRKGNGVGMKQTDDGAWVHLGDLPALTQHLTALQPLLQGEAEARSESAPKPTPSVVAGEGSSPSASGGADSERVKEAFANCLALATTKHQEIAALRLLDACRSTQPLPDSTSGEGAPCENCGGSGVQDGYDIEPECCGNTTSSGECRGDCVVPKQVPAEEPCEQCGGSGIRPAAQPQFPDSTRTRLREAAGLLYELATSLDDRSRGEADGLATFLRDLADKGEPTNER